MGFSHDVAKRELRKVMKIIDEKTINPYDKAHGFDTDELTATGEVAIITTNQLFTPTNNVNDLARAANGRAAPQAKAAVPAFATTRVSGTANRAMAGRRLKRARTPAEKQIIGQQCYNCAEGRHDYSTCTAPFKEKIPGVRYLNGTPIMEKPTEDRTWKELAFFTGVLVWDWVLSGENRRSLSRVLAASHALGKARLTKAWQWTERAAIAEDQWLHLDSLLVSLLHRL